MPTIQTLNPHNTIAPVQSRVVPMTLMTEIDPTLPSNEWNMIRLMVVVEDSHEGKLVDLRTNNGGYCWLQKLVRHHFPKALSFESWEVQDCPF